MTTKFDYIILTEFNEWVATGKQETQKELDDEIKRLKDENPDIELVIFKAETMIMTTY
jgi:hypothetical protein